MDASLAYHHTSLAHLPFILRDGALRPLPAPTAAFGTLKVPPVAYLWATTSATGDRTTSIWAAQQDGMVPVRIAFPPDRFVPWGDIRARETGMAARYNEALQIAASRVGQDHGGWLARFGPLSMIDAVQVEAKHRDDRWSRVDLDRDDIDLTTRDGRAVLRFPLFGVWWQAERRPFPSGHLGYAVRQEDPANV